MYELKVTNEYDQTLQLTQNPNYTIKEVSGLDPPEAIINKTRNANTDGSEFNSSYLNDRQIIITMTIEAPAEEASQVAELLQTEMMEAAVLRVPLSVEVKTGENWYETK